jgi:hypothetical protein
MRIFVAPHAVRAYQERAKGPLCRQADAEIGEGAA